MRDHRRSGRPAVLFFAVPFVVVMFVAAGIVGCGGGRSADVEVPVVITIDRGDGRSWTATGTPVDRGDLCDRGTQKLIDVRDLDGSAIGVAEYARRREAGLDSVPPDLTTDHLSVMEFACADGTGTFTLVVEECDAGSWDAIGGTGSYRGLTGSGTVDVERDPPTDADDPPGGVPTCSRLTGSLAVPARAGSPGS